MRKVKDEEFPQHLGFIRDTFLYNGKVDGKSDMRDIYDYVDKGWRRVYRLYPYTSRFWEKHIGDDYSECRKKLISNIKKKFGYSDYKIDEYVYLKSENRINNGRFYYSDQYYVNNDGIICKIEYIKEKRNNTPYEIGSREYYRYKAEERDKKKKAYRDYYKAKEERLNFLLTNIEDDRKKKEEEINRVKIIKHGFDPDMSFRKV